MKLDKETLVKQRFWILLGVFVPLVLIVLLVLSASVSGKIADERKAFEDSQKALSGINNPKNVKFIEILNKKKTTLSDQKDVVWKDAWQTQDGMMSWPKFSTPGMQQQLTRAYFGEEIPDRDRRYYGDTAYKEYVPEVYRELQDHLSPVELKDGWDRLFRYVGKEDERGKWHTTPPTTEECWLAQEDVWVQRELALVIKSALDALAKFKPAGTAPKVEGAVTQYRLQNTNWELNLVLERNEARQLVVSPKSTLKNINAAKRTLLLGRGKQPGVKLRLQQGGIRADVVIEGEPVAWDKTAEFKKTTRIDNLDPSKPLDVEQVFDWYTSPIKRIDDIQLSYRSHRIFNLPLTFRQIGKKEEAVAEAPAASSSAGPGMPGMPGGSSMGGPSPMQGLGGKGPGGSDKVVNGTPNGLDRDRYIEVTNQVRRMPVAIVTVLDQAYIEDVLTAFANSRLRIQTTQSHWQHVHDIKPSVSDDNSSDQPGSSDDNRRTPMPGMSSPGGRSSPVQGGPAGAGSKFPPMGGSMGGPPKGGSAIGAIPGPDGRPKGSSAGPAGMPMSKPGGNTAPAMPGMKGGPSSKSGFPDPSADLAEGDEDDPNLVELVVYGIASLYERFPPPKPDTGATTEAPK